MMTPPLLGRAGEMHRQEIGDQIGRERRAQRAVAGTRMRGGFFHLSLRQAQPEREPPDRKSETSPLFRTPRPAVT